MAKDYSKGYAPPPKIMPRGNPINNTGIKGDLTQAQMMTRAGIDPPTVMNPDPASSLLDPDESDQAAQD